MKKLHRKLLLSFALTLVMIMTFVIPASAAGPVKVELGTTSTFAVLAGSAISNTGATIINGDAGGDVGLSPSAAITGFTSDIAIANHVTMSGTQHINNAVAIQAKTDLSNAYLDAAGRAVTATIPTELGGTTLTTGVYHSTPGTFGITGTLTLDAQGDPEAVFIFKTDSTLITAANSNIELINGARYCRVFWQVGSSATLGTDSVFRGHIFALTSITVTTRAMVQGQLLALNGAVTLDTNTITNGICAAPATLTVIKQVINDNNGTATAADFTLHVKTAGASGNDVYGSPAQGTALGTVYKLVAGNYTVSENAAAGYTVSYSGADSSGNITLASGDVRTVTVTNNDVTPPVLPPPTYYPPLINVVKTPSPLALTSAGGAVTYTYVVTNVGMVSLSNVSVTDDKVSNVRYVSGDINSDSWLQTSETWIYTGTATHSVTTTNTAVAKGSANGMTAYDVAYATVTVAPTEVYPPLINVIKTPNPLALTIGGGSVTYTYRVTNPGLVALSDVRVTDNKLSPVTYVSGDVNADKLLQPGETWVYTGTATLSATTTNTATAKGSANGMTATDIAIATVVVTTPIITPPVTETVTGGLLPATATPWYTILLIGACMVTLGLVGFKIKKTHE